MENELLSLATLMNFQKGIANMIIAMNAKMNNDEDDEDDLVIEIRRFFEKQTPPRIANYVIDVVNNYDDIQFQQNFRITRVAFEHLLEIISPIIKKNVVGGRPQRDAKHQILAVIWLLATPDSYRSVGERFNMSKVTLFKCFIRIINALNTLMTHYIKWPTGLALEETKARFSALSIFDNLIGVVDGTYVPLSGSKEDKVAYTNRKCFTSMTLQAICDADMKYIDVYCGWPSSVPDVRIFKNSHVYETAQNNTTGIFPNGEYILGEDKAYPLLDWCIPPYMDRGRLTQQQILFNQKHSSCRQVIERSFALLFGRFRRLQKLDLHRTDWAASTITACCVLHNICLGFDQDVVGDYLNERLTFLITNNHDESQMIRQVLSEHAMEKRDNICHRI